MTKSEALLFDYKSVAHAEVLRATCPKCEPYEDWLTLRRWNALGFRIAKGQHSARLMVFIEKDEIGKDKKVEKVTYPKVAHVFCRCQLAK